MTVKIIKKTLLTVLLLGVAQAWGAEASRKPQMVNDFSGRFVCYGFEGQIVVMGNGQQKAAGTAAFAAKADSKNLAIRDAKGSFDPEKISKDDLEIFPVQKDSNDKLPDFIVVHKKRNFALRCETD